MKATELLKNWLSEQGFKSEIDKDGDLAFKYQGANLFCTNDENDLSFFRILMPNIYKVEDNRDKVLEAANMVTRDIKVVKAFLVEDRLWLAVEMFLGENQNIDSFVERCLNILLAARDRVAKEIFEKK